MLEEASNLHVSALCFDIGVRQKASYTKHFMFFKWLKSAFTSEDRQFILIKDCFVQDAMQC